MSESIPTEIIMFRANHVLSEIYNIYIRTSLFLFLLTAGVAQIISAVTLITQTSTDSVPCLANLFFASVVLQASFTIFIVFGFGGEFHKSSDLSLKRLKQKTLTFNTVTTKERKYLQRFLNSCQVGKIKFGLSNFVETTTAPIFQLFCVERIIDLLLLR